MRSGGLPGFQPIQEHIQKCHLFLHTATWEGLPRVMLEARAMQRQSIAFDSKGSRDIPDVILSAEGDVNDFADKVAWFGAKTISGSHVLALVSPSLDSAVVAKTIARFLENTRGH